MLNNEKKTKISTKWDVWKKFTHSKKKEKTNKDIFIENWQQIQVYYYKGFMNSSKPISQTGLTHNLRQLSKYIITEAESPSIENKIKSYNPDGCLEYFIEKQIAVKLVDYATKNVPIGMHLEVLRLFEQILSCETIFLNLFPELNFRTSFHNLLILSLNFPKQQSYTSKNVHDSYDEIKYALVKLINVIFVQLLKNPSYISFFYNNKKIFNESNSDDNCEFIMSSDVSSQFLIFDVLFKLFSDNVKCFSLYDQTVLLGMDLLTKLETIHFTTNEFVNQDDFNDIYKTNKRNSMSLLRFSDIVDSQHISSIEEEILLYILNKSSIFEIINEQFALLYAATIVNLPSSDNKENDLHNIMNIYMYQQNISFHPKHSKHILKSYISAIKTKYPILKTNYSYNSNEYNERLHSYWTFINIILERSPKCVFWKYLEKFEQYVINSFIQLDFQNEEFGLNSTICINDLYCKSNIPKLKELLFLIIWKNQKLVLRRISQTEDKILSFETLKLLYNILSGYDYYIYRYIISNFILDNKNIYNLEKYKHKQTDDIDDDVPKEFFDEKTKKCNTFFYNIILHLIKLIPKDVIDTKDEFDLFLNGVENDYFLTHDIKDNQIIPNSLLSDNDNSTEDENNSHTNSMIQKNEDSISQETLVGNESLFLSPSTSSERLNSHNISTDEFDLIEKEEELKVKATNEYYSICPTDVYVKESYERIRNCTKIMMSWNEMTKEKNDNEIDKFMLLSSEIKTNFCKELIRCLENFFRNGYEHNVLLTGCISRLFYLINDEFHIRLFKNEDHTNSVFLQALRKLSEYASRVSLTIENFTNKLKYVKQEIFFDRFYESISNKSFYNCSYKDYTKLLNISHEENQFLFSYILLQEFIKEIISIEMAFIMFDPEQNSNKHQHRVDALQELRLKFAKDEVESIKEENPLETSDVLNIIDKALNDEVDYHKEEKEFKEIQREMQRLNINETFLRELEKEENKEEEDSEGVMKNIEDINDVILKSIQQNFSEKYSFDEDMFKEGFSFANESQGNTTTVTGVTSNMNCSLDLFGNISGDSTSLKNGELNITQEIKKLNALFNNNDDINVSDIVNPFDYESLLMENSMTTNTSDMSYLMNLRKNSSGSFLYDGDVAGNSYMFGSVSGRRKSSIMRAGLPTTASTVEDEIEEEDFNRIMNNNHEEEINTTPKHSSKKQNEKELQIPLVSESNTEYYKYLKELPASPVLPATLLKPSNDGHSSSSDSLLSPLDNEEDLEYLEYLEKVTQNDKNKKKAEKEEKERFEMEAEADEEDEGEENEEEEEEEEEDDGSRIDNEEELEDEFERESEEIVSCSSPTVGTANSVNINDIEDDEDTEKYLYDSKDSSSKKSKKNLKKFFSNQKQKINSIFNHRSNIVQPEDNDLNRNYILSVKEDESKDYYDSSYTEFYSETFDETSFLKKNLNTGFGYL